MKHSSIFNLLNEIRWCFNAHVKANIRISHLALPQCFRPAWAACAQQNGIVIKH
jgi:hypothetical protein